MRKQLGISLVSAIVWMAVLGFFGVLAAKCLPVWMEFFAVQKIFKTMDNAGQFKGTVWEIRKAYDIRNAIEDVKAVSGADLEISKSGDETTVTAAWSAKVPLVYNSSACFDFVVTYPR